MFRQDVVAQLEDGACPVQVRRNARAKKYVLRVDALTGAIKVTAPSHVRTGAIQRFVDDHVDWITAERDKVLARPAVTHGSRLCFLDEEYELSFTDEAPRSVRLSAGLITVGGPADQAGGRLERWLRARAKETLTSDASEFAHMLGVTFSRVGVGDMKSRWGSCTAQGNLRFNWRLVLAPGEIRRYVAAHEVAHLLELNHSPKFWRHVQACMPDYEQHRRWLRREGHELMRVRFKNHQTDG